MEKMLKVLGIYLLLYIILFIIAPFICDSVGYHLLGNEGAFIVAIFTVVVVLAGMIFITDRLLIWYIGLIVYFLLINIYHPQEGQYNIGTWGLFGASYIEPEIAWLGILMFLAQTIFWEFIVWACIKFVRVRKSI